MRFQHSTRRAVRAGVVPALLFAATVLVFTALITLTTCVWYTRTNHGDAVSKKSLNEHSYVGDDYPAYYPLEVPDVSLTPENTIHYQIFTEDADREWTSVFPAGGGFLRLGEEDRIFGVALFHQMHCLARIRHAMNIRQSSEHVHHCFNYLRQTILCEANPTIEPVIPILGRRSVNAEIPRTCRDWTAVYNLAKDNYEASMGRARAVYI